MNGVNITERSSEALEDSYPAASNTVRGSPKELD